MATHSRTDAHARSNSPGQVTFLLSVVHCLSESEDWIDDDNDNDDDDDVRTDNYEDTAVAIVRGCSHGSSRTFKDKAHYTG